MADRSQIKQLCTQWHYKQANLEIAAASLQRAAALGRPGPSWPGVFPLMPATHSRTPQDNLAAGEGSSKPARGIKDATQSPEAGDGDDDVQVIPNHKRKKTEPQPQEEATFLFEVQVPHFGNLEKNFEGKFNHFFWEVFHVKKWCFEKHDKEFCQKILRECFEKSYENSPNNHTYWGERDFITTLLTLIGILKDGHVVSVDKELINFNAVSWAFVVFKKLKDQSSGETIRRVLRNLNGKADLKQGLRQLTKLWR